MNKPKKQGTAAESRIVQLHRQAELISSRLPEGGKDDEGDIEILTLAGGGNYAGFRIIGEVKDRERINAAEALERAVTKSGTHRTALFWTQRIPGTGLIRRKTRRCVVITEDLWLELLGSHSGSGE